METGAYVRSMQHREKKKDRECHFRALGDKYACLVRESLRRKSVAFANILWRVRMRHHLNRAPSTSKAKVILDRRSRRGRNQGKRGAAPDLRRSY